MQGFRHHRALEFQVNNEHPSVPTFAVEVVVVPHCANAVVCTLKNQLGRAGRKIHSDQVDNTAVELKRRFLSESRNLHQFRAEAVEVVRVELHAKTRRFGQDHGIALHFRPADIAMVPEGMPFLVGMDLQERRV